MYHIDLIGIIDYAAVFIKKNAEIGW